MTALIPLERFDLAPATTGSRPVLERLQSLVPASLAVADLELPALADGEQYRFHFDMTRCIGCRSCEVACNEQNNNPAHVAWRRVGELEGGDYPHVRRLHVSMACNHCLDPTCLSGCPVDAYSKLPNGIVKHDAETCIGCRYCTWTCPYGVPQYHPERRVVTKCHLCADRLAEGQLPACVQACPTSAIQVEKVDVAGWQERLAAGTAPAEAPGMPPAALTGSTTRFTVPEGIPASFGRERSSPLRPEEPHWPLVLLLVLSQWSLGLFAAALLLDLAAVTPPLARFGALELAPGGAAAGLGFLIGQLALAAGVFHLGRPAFALRAMRAWRHSWLSREAVLFAAFAFAGAAAAAARCLDGREPSAVSLALTVLAFTAGGAGVFASVEIYLLPARPSWNSWRTPALFFGTAVRLGTTTALLLLAALPERSAPDLTWAFAGAASLSAIFFAFLPWCAAARALAGEGTPERAAALLLTRRFAGLLWSRTVILLVAAALAPAAVASYPHPAALFLAAGAQILGLVSEIAGRYLFFVTGVPVGVPGHFFESRSGFKAATVP